MLREKLTSLQGAHSSTFCDLYILHQNFLLQSLELLQRALLATCGNPLDKQPILKCMSSN